MANICKECADPSWSGQAPIVVPPLPVDGKVIEFDTFDDFPAKGESGFIYVDKENNDFYKWDIEGEQYSSIGSSTAEKDYEKLNHLPLINGVKLIGDKSSDDLGITDEIDTAVASEATARDAAIAVEAAARDAAIAAEATARDTAISAEATTRAAADLALQTQIDGITSASDVVDVVGTYADLEDYDTSKLHDNDIIKVLQDETHNDAITYYRWIVDDEDFTYIGLQGPFYTKSETNALLGEKQDELTAGENITISEDGVISAASTYVTITVTPDMVISEEPVTFQFTEAEDAIITDAQNMLIKIDATQVGISATLFIKSNSNRAGEYVLTNNVSTYSSSALTVHSSTANVIVYRHSDMKAVYSVKDLLDEDKIAQETGQSESLVMSQKAITDALADAGGVKVLTQDDYNYPTNNPTEIALWLLPEGFYTVPKQLANKVRVNAYEYVPYNASGVLTSRSSGDSAYMEILMFTNNYIKTTETQISNGNDFQTYTYLNNSNVVNNLTSTSTSNALSAAQGKALKDMIDALPEAPAVVQTIGTSTTDVMSQDAVSGLLFGKSGNKYSNEKLCVGKSQNNLQLNGSAEFGTSSDTNAIGQISFPYGNMNNLNITKAGVFNIGVFNTSFGYDGSSNYRLLTGLHDPVNDHDAATKGYVDAHGGPTIVQTTGTSTTDVMSQKAVTDMIYADGNTSRVAISGAIPSFISSGTAINQGAVSAAGAIAICGGWNSAQAIGTASITIGSSSSANSQGAIAIGAGAQASSVGEFNIGAQSGWESYGYNNTNYRLLTGLHDGINAHDAATYGQLSALETRIAALEAQLGNA